MEGGREGGKPTAGRDKKERGGLRKHRLAVSFLCIGFSKEMHTKDTHHITSPRGRRRTPFRTYLLNRGHSSSTTSCPLKTHPRRCLCLCCCSCCSSVVVLTALAAAAERQTRRRTDRRRSIVLMLMLRWR